MNRLPIDILKLIWKEIIVVYSTKEEVWYHNINYVCIDKLQTRIFLNQLYLVVKDLPNVLDFVAFDTFTNNDFNKINLPGIKFDENPNFEIVFKEKQTKENIGGDYIIQVYDENDNLLITKQQNQQKEIKLKKFLVGYFDDYETCIVFFMNGRSKFLDVQWLVDQYIKVYKEMNCDFPKINITGLKCNRGVLTLKI